MWVIGIEVTPPFLGVGVVVLPSAGLTLPCVIVIVVVVVAPVVVVVVLSSLPDPFLILLLVLPVESLNRLLFRKVLCAMCPEKKAEYIRNHTA